MLRWLLAGGAIWLGVGTAWADCLTYGSPTTLTGTLISKVFPGPPNYESVAEGDSPETAYLLKLDRPTCVAAGHTESGEEAVASVDEIQLVRIKGATRNMGKHIMVIGDLFPGLTGHHHTAVLLDVKTLRRR
ncbi:DUF4431 domain-containing protein [Labrys neptuniae]